MAKNDAAAYANFSDAELKAFKKDKQRFFKGTIAVCVVYGAFAAILLLVAFFDSRGRQILTQDLLPFVITFVAFMILIIIIIVVQVLAFKPTKMQNDLYDPDSCPDYWTMVKTPESDIPSTASDVQKHLLKYRCVPDSSVFDIKARWNSNNNLLTDDSYANGVDNAYPPQKIKKINDKPVAYAAIGTGTDTITTKLKNASQTMYRNIDSTTTSNDNLRCDQVYPAFLATEDELNFPNKPNTLRCKYAEKCGIPWTSVCPDKS